MANIYIRRTGRDPFRIPQNQVVTDIKSGKLLADDEISPDGQSWIRLDQHQQLGALFNQAFPSSTAQAKPSPAAESNNFIKKLWNGEYPLWKTFWLFGMTYPMCVLIPIQLVYVWKMQTVIQDTMNRNLAANNGMAEMVTTMMVEMKTYFLVFALIMLIFIAYAFVVNIGLWRSANQYTGDSFWRILARIWVVFYFIALPINLYGIYDISANFEGNVKLFEERIQEFEDQFDQIKEKEMSTTR